MSNPWFRMYAEFAHDPKVQMLSETMQRRYVMLMCLRCSNALETLHETEVAFALRISDEELAATKALFIAKGFIDSAWNLLNWEKRQYASDSSAARVAKHRALKKQAEEQAGNADVTLPKRQANALDTDTDTDTDKKKNKKDSAPALTIPELVAEGVSEETAAEYLAHRKAKRAKLTARAWDDIKTEIFKAGLTAEQGCRKALARGWTGFEAAWLRDDRSTKQPTGETAWQKSQRERVAEFAPSIARRAPGHAAPITIIEEFRDVPAIASR